MKDAYIVSMARTPVGKCRGKLAPVPAEQLGAAVIRQVVADINLDPQTIDEVIMGNLWAHDIADMARVSLLEAGLPWTVPGLRVDRQCSSALDAIGLAGLYIQSGHADTVLAGGAESDSRRPYVLFKNETEYSVAPPEFLKQYKASSKEVGDPRMGVTAENLAEQYRLTREDLDAYAVMSHQRAAAAQADGRLSPHMVPIPVRTRKKQYVVDQDECIRPDTNMETLAKLPASFRENGVVTAGNSCPMSDGAGCVAMMSGERMQETGLKPLAKYIDWVSVGVDPNIMGIGPAYAIRKLLARTGLKLDDIGLIELNEAFCAQTLACIKELRLDRQRLNIDGGAIALGHPLGATGAVLTVKLLNQLKREGRRYGIVAFCCGGGQGAAALFENTEGR